MDVLAQGCVWPQVVGNQLVVMKPGDLITPHPEFGPYGCQVWRNPSSDDDIGLVEDKLCRMCCGDIGIVVSVLSPGGVCVMTHFKRVGWVHPGSLTVL